MAAEEVGFCKTCGTVTEVAVLPQDRLQARIIAAMEKRGYRRGLTPGKFLGMQFARMMVTLGEAASEARGVIPTLLGFTISDAADQGKHELHYDHKWTEGFWDIEQLDSLWKRLVDVQIVLVCMAGAVNELLKEQRDLMQGAVEKVERDVEKVVR